MSYNLTPIVIDLPKLRSLMGCKDTAFLRQFIRKKREQLLGFDSIGGEMDDYEDDINAEYDAFEEGDFSSVDLKKVYAGRKQDDEDDEELKGIVEGLAGKGRFDPKTKEEAMKKLSGMVENMFDDDEDADEKAEEAEEEPTGRPTSTGAALVHLILGGNQDPSCWYKYGYALQLLCEEIGEIAEERDSWCSIRSDPFDAVDAVLLKVGAKRFSTAVFLKDRTPPVATVKPDDFPGTGYLTRREIAVILPRISAKKMERALRTEDEDLQEWLRPAIDEFRSWLQVAAEKNRDLVFFYS